MTTLQILAELIALEAWLIENRLLEAAQKSVDIRKKIEDDMEAQAEDCIECEAVTPTHYAHCLKYAEARN
jgi:hypothetical protein